MPAERSHARFYDAWTRRLLRDYVRGNARAESAIAFAAAALPGRAAAVLDIGCGIGWSTSELAKRDGAEVLGLDLSPRLVETARALFGDESNIRFDVLDFVTDELPVGSYDAVVLLDVYEHFPAGARGRVNARLGGLLRDDGRVILSMPTVAHQNFLRDHKPEGLQPVDEDVTEDDVQAIAAAVEGRVLELDTVSIWRPGDYQHAVVERGRPHAPDAARAQLARQPEREQRVRRRLGLRWTPGAGFVATRGPRVVCVAVAAAPALLDERSRTYVEQLSAHVHVLAVPQGRTEADESLLLPVVSRPLRRVARLVGRNPAAAEDIAHRRLPGACRSWLYRRYLRRIGADAVFGESARAAAELRSACRAERIPLVVGDGVEAVGRVQQRLDDALSGGA